MEDEAGLICAPDYPKPRSCLLQIVDSLGGRMTTVLRKRFGLDDGRCWTLAEVAEMYGVTPERIRQAEAKALRKMRQPECINILAEMAPDYGVEVYDA